MLNLGLVWHVQHPGLSIVYSGHVQNTSIAWISPSGYYCASADLVGTGMSTPRIRESVSYIIYQIVRIMIWDSVGQDQTLKGEYKFISGRM